MKRTDVDKVLIIGSGPIVIGQACEFDYSGTQACKALRACGYKVVLVNSNPATIMTDPVMADATYIEPLNEARLEQIIEKERPDAILPNLGGQTGLNLSMELAKKGAPASSTRSKRRSSSSKRRSAIRSSYVPPIRWAAPAAVSATTSRS